MRLGDRQIIAGLVGAYAPSPGNISAKLPCYTPSRHPALGTMSRCGRATRLAYANMTHDLQGYPVQISVTFYVDSLVCTPRVYGSRNMASPRIFFVLFVLGL